jgi:hypothetical protein
MILFDGDEGKDFGVTAQPDEYLTAESRRQLLGGACARQLRQKPQSVRVAPGIKPSLTT